eukprot:105542_1
MSQQWKVTGSVKVFDLTKGFGFITCDDGSGDVFVHYSEVQTLGYKTLNEGELVEFDIVVQDDGRRKAINVTIPNRFQACGGYGAYRGGRGGRGRGGSYNRGCGGYRRRGRYRPKQSYKPHKPPTIEELEELFEIIESGHTVGEEYISAKGMIEYVDMEPNNVNAPKLDSNECIDDGNVQFVMDSKRNDADNLNDIVEEDNGNIQMVMDTKRNVIYHENDNPNVEDIKDADIVDVWSTSGCKEEFNRFLASSIPNGISKYLQQFQQNEMDDIRYSKVLDDDVLKNEIKMKTIDRKLFVEKISKYNDDRNSFEKCLESLNMLEKYQTIFENNGIASFWSFHHFIKSMNSLQKLIQNDTDANILWNMTVNDDAQQEGVF